MRAKALYVDRVEPDDLQDLCHLWINIVGEKRMLLALMAVDQHVEVKRHENFLCSYFNREIAVNGKEINPFSGTGAYHWINSQSRAFLSISFTKAKIYYGLVRKVR